MFFHYKIVKLCDRDFSDFQLLLLQVMLILKHHWRQSFRNPIQKLHHLNRTLTSAHLDFRALENLKNDSALCKDMMKSAKSVLLHDRKYLVQQKPGGKSCSLHITQFKDLKDSSIQHTVLLTVVNNCAIFATSVNDVTKFTEDGKQLIEPRPALFLLSEEDQGLATMGLNLLQWQMDNKFCSKCQTELIYHISGRSCRCENCSVTYFPRYNPVVIMLVVCGDYCLLGRNKQFPSRMFSALAGFIDVGERIEQAVVREVSEEVSVEVDLSQVRYVSSDFWGGFRRNYSPELMIGCVATVNTMQTPCCSEEIAEARWFHKDEIREALEKSKMPGLHKLQTDGLLLPPPFATAHKLAALWCKES